MSYVYSSYRFFAAIVVIVALVTCSNQSMSRDDRQPELFVSQEPILASEGDTFWDLAQLHNVNVRALAKWNGMAPRDPLTPGQKLVIWSRSGIETSSLEGVVLALPQQRSVTKRIGYRVRRGDSLTKISRKFRVSVAQLKRWNHLPEGKYLQPGQRLTVYVDVMQTSS